MSFRACSTAIAAAAITVVACNSDTSALATAPAATAASVPEMDALWALAPGGMKFGVVASPRALAAFDHGTAALAGLLAAAPELAQVKRELGAIATSIIGAHHGESIDSLLVPLSTYGLTTDKGMAMFAAADGELAVFPVADRAAFIRARGGHAEQGVDLVDGYTCKPVADVYACGKPAAMLDRLGTGKLADPVALVRARGEIEVSATVPLTPSASATIAVVAQLAPGAIVLRAAVSAPSLVPPEVRARIGTSFTPRVDPASTAGFGVIDIANLFGPNADIPGFATSAVAGPLTASVPAGAAALDLRLPFTSAEAAHAQLARCGTSYVLAALGAKLDGDVCRVAIAQLGLDLEARVDGTELHVASRNAPGAAAAIPLTGAGLELATGAWALAVYGRGTTLAMPPLALGDVPPDDAAALFRMMSLLDEVGVGVQLDGDVLRVLATVRTAWANPDDVVAKLLAIPQADLASGKALATAQAIAAAAPDSPLATDLRAGFTGLSVPTLLIGAVAVGLMPAFQGFIHHDPDGTRSAERAVTQGVRDN